MGFANCKISDLEVHHLKTSGGEKPAFLAYAWGLQRAGEMKIILLGTGDAPGTPVIGCHCKTCEDARRKKWERKRFSILIQKDNRNILIDTSPDLRRQLLALNIDRIDAVIWTHCHFDHFGGFGEFYRVQENIKVYSSPEVHEDIGRFMQFLKYKPIEIESYNNFNLFGIDFTLFDVNHPTVRRSHGIKIEYHDFKIIITGDTNKDIPKESFNLMRGADLLIINVLAPEGFKLRKHLNAKDAFRIAKELKARKTVFSHIGHFFPPHNIAIKKYPLGYDGQEFSFEKKITLDKFL